MSTVKHTDEQLNYFRMVHIVFDLIPGGLRKVFRQQWDYRFKRSLGRKWTNSTLNGRDFYRMEYPARREEDERILEIIKEGNTTNWDCSCLFFAILFSKSIGNSRSKPLSRKVYDNVHVLRTVRNDIAHIKEAKLDNVQFQRYVGRVFRTFISLGLATKDIETLKKQQTFRTKEVDELKRKAGRYRNEREISRVGLKASRVELLRMQKENESLLEEMNAAVEPFCLLSSKPPHEIIRRSRDIEKIMEKMQELCKGSNGTVSTIYLSGVPGSGKTQLARQLGENFYNIRSRDTEGLTFVATLNAETIDTLVDSYITLPKTLGITEYAVSGMEDSRTKNPKDTLKRVMHLVSPKIAKFANWLIIVDAVVDLALIRSYLPRTGSNEWGHGQVLITTQDSSTIPLNAPHTYHHSPAQ